MFTESSSSFSSTLENKIVKMEKSIERNTKTVVSLKGKLALLKAELSTSFGSFKNRAETNRKNFEIHNEMDDISKRISLLSSLTEEGERDLKKAKISLNEFINGTHSHQFWQMKREGFDIDMSDVIITKEEEWLEAQEEISNFFEHIPAKPRRVEKSTVFTFPDGSFIRKEEGTFDENGNKIEDDD